MKDAKDIKQRLANVDWQTVAQDMHAKGYAQVSGLLTPQECGQFIADYDQPKFYRRTIPMERYRFGSGEYKYFAYPLPDLIQTIRETVYPKLAPIANQWMEWLRIDQRFPITFTELQKLCHENKQTLPTVLILKYGKGGHNTLHQDLYGDIFFPMQLVLLLNEPELDYTGGEFVMTQQVPRAQSKAIVLNPGRGDFVLFTTNFRPIKGERGIYRAQMRHGVSEVHEGNRHTLGIIFHDALS
jgi:uncharacterized protein